MSAGLEDLRRFFQAFPQGAGETWLAEHFGSTPAAVAQACQVLGLERVDCGDRGTEWRAPFGGATNVLPFRRRTQDSTHAVTPGR